MLLMSCTAKQPLSLYDLRCEDLDSPTAIASTTPHFSWKLSADASATKQTHYEVMVATTEKALKNNQPDLERSG